MKIKKRLALILALVMVVSMLSGCSSKKSDNEKSPEVTSPPEVKDELDFPKKDFQGTIMWSAGGINDTVSRAVGPFVKEYLNNTIIFTNRPGAAGGIATAYVNDQPADGYNLLFGAENPQIAKVMGTSELDYSDFIPINIFCSSVGVLIVKADSKYNTIEDLVDDMLARPNKVKMSTTGPGGLPFTVASMMKAINKTEPQMTVFDGEADATAAVIGGHVDYLITTLGSAIEFINAGKVRGLAVFHNEVVDVIKDIPLIVDIYPEYEKYMPWGPFYGVFVKKGTPQDIVDILTDAFDKAVNNPEYQEILINLGAVPMGIKSDEAIDYVDKYRSVTSWLLYDAGSTEHSPEEFGIKRVE